MIGTAAGDPATVIDNAGSEGFFVPIYGLIWQAGGE